MLAPQTKTTKENSTLRVFLGGTVNGSTWREEIISHLSIDYFNPVIENWNEAARLREIQERQDCDYNLYLLSPKMVGYYSIAEVVDDSFKKPGQTLFCYISEDGEHKFTNAQLKSLRYLGKIVEENGGIWCKSMDEISTFFNKLQSKSEYYRIYQNLLQNAVNWHRNQRDSSYLLRGFPLIDSRRWIKEARHKDVLAPTQLIKEFYEASREEELSSHKISAFISYARTPSLSFAKELCHNLEKNEIDIWFDKHSIRAGVDFREEIATGIKKAGNFIYVITDRSIQSPYCQMELDMAKEMGKRILPIQQGDVSEEGIDPNIQPIHRLFYNGDPQEFTGLISSLTEILKEGQEFIQDHTKILQKALNWEKNRKPNNLLLNRTELVKVFNWLASSIDLIAPARPTPIQCEYISKSKQLAENGFVDFWICSFREGKFESNLIHAFYSRALTASSSWERSGDITEIVKAAKFILIISAGTINNENCLNELETARKYQIEIIPILIEKVGVEEILLDHEQQRLVDLTERKHSTPELVPLIKNVLRHQLGTFKELRLLRYHYANWSRCEEHDAFLMREFRSEYYQDWSSKHAKLQGKLYPELSRYLEICEARSPELVTDVFIGHHQESYQFAFRLNEKLADYKKISWAEQPFISEKQQSLVCLNNIEASENFVGIVSENFFIDKTGYQINKAIEIGKRIVLIKDDPDITIPEAYADYAIIDFTEDFDLGVTRLIRQLDTDFQYVRRHNHLLKDALNWDKSGQGTDKLIRGKDELDSIQQWLAEAEMKSPRVTELQKEYFNESLKAHKRAKRLNQYVVYAIVLLSIFSLVFGVWAGIKTHEANENLDIANQQKAEAEENNQRAIDNARKAEENEKKARLNADEAKENAQKAEENEKRAVANEKLAEAKTREAEEQKQKAIGLQNKAERNAQTAIEQQKIAEDNKKMADRLAMVELAKNKALVSEKLLFISHQAARDSLISAYEQLDQFPENQKSNIFFQAFSRVNTAINPETIVLSGERALVKTHVQDNSIHALSENGIFKVIDLRPPFQKTEVKSAKLLNALTFTPCMNDQIAVGNRFGQIAIYYLELENKQLSLISNWQTHDQTSITGLSLIKSNYLLSTGYDGSLAISSMDQSQNHPIFKKQVSLRITALDVAPSQNHFAIIASDSIKLYAIEALKNNDSGEQEAVVSTLATMHLTNQSPTVIKFITNDQLIAGYASGQLRMWNHNGQLMPEIEHQQEHRKAITAIAARNGTIVTGDRDAKVVIRIWTNQEVDHLPDHVYKYPGHRNPNEIGEISFISDDEVISMDNKNLLKWSTSIDQLYQTTKNLRP